VLSERNDLLKIVSAVIVGAISIVICGFMANTFAWIVYGIMIAIFIIT